MSQHNLIFCGISQFPERPQIPDPPWTLRRRATKKADAVALKFWGGGGGEKGRGPLEEAALLRAVLPLRGFLARLEARRRPWRNTNSAVAERLFITIIALGSFDPSLLIRLQGVINVMESARAGEAGSWSRSGESLAEAGAAAVTIASSLGAEQEGRGGPWEPERSSWLCWSRSRCPTLRCRGPRGAPRLWSPRG